MKIEFAKPHSFEGQEYNGLELDLDGLTGNDLIAAEKETRAMGSQTPVVEFSKTYQAVVGAKAANVPVDMITSLPAREFSRITVYVANFLLE